MSTNDSNPRSRPPRAWSQVREQTRHWLLLPWYGAEWVFDWTAYVLRHWKLVDVLRHLTHFTVLVAAISYFANADDRSREKRYQAWQVINLAQGKPGSGGRRAALEELNDEGVSLRGVNVGQAVLDGLSLGGGKLAVSIFDSASLIRSDFQRADLRRASFRNAILSFSNFDGSVARRANFTNARFQQASMRNASLSNARLDSTYGFQFVLTGSTLNEVQAEAAMFQNAHLDSVSAAASNFVNAELIGVDLRRADLHDANLSGSRLKWSDLYRANLANTDLSGVTLQAADLRFSHLESIKNWRDIRSLQLANLYGVSDAPDGFVKWAVDSMDAVKIADYDEWRKMVRGLVGDYLFDYTAFSQPAP